jgi:hypothetical protein
MDFYFECTITQMNNQETLSYSYVENEDVEGECGWDEFK